MKGVKNAVCWIYQLQEVDINSSILEKMKDKLNVLGRKS